MAHNQITSLQVILPEPTLECHCSHSSFILQCLSHSLYVPYSQSQVVHHWPGVVYELAHITLATWPEGPRVVFGVSGHPKWKARHLSEAPPSSKLFTLLCTLVTSKSVLVQHSTLVGPIHCCIFSEYSHYIFLSDELKHCPQKAPRPIFHQW